MLTGFFLLMSCLRCTEDHARPSDRSGNSGDICKKDTKSGLIPDYNALFDSILNKEISVTENPDNFDALSELFETAFIKKMCEYLVVGIGAADRKTPDNTIQRITQKKSANASANRWAMFLKTYHTGNNLAYGSPVPGRIMYSRTIKQRTSRDTLYILKSIPVSSIVLY
ncbi:MAG: hypothetical protein ACOCSE_04460 [Chitinivibrionales bacterium]